MKEKISKILLSVVASVMMIGLLSSNLAVCNLNSPLVITAQAAAKQIHFKSTKITVTTGETYTLKLLNKDGKTISPKSIKWSSSSKKIATINSKGVVNAVKSGTVTITAKYKSKKYTCKITIKNAPHKVKPYRCI